MKILLTGGAGFIGSRVAEKLLEEGHSLLIIDNFNDFYNEQIKRNNVRILEKNPNCRIEKIDIESYKDLIGVIDDKFDAIIHLAAKAGVRPSILDPLGYQKTNVGGTHNLLELAKENGIRRFVFASSSSVYGVNPEVPWNEMNTNLLPISPYASTKISGELLGHVYSHLYGIRFISLRFFTVFGPRQRPDLAIHKFTDLILNEKPIPFYGNGRTKRDYTFVDDIVQGVINSLSYDKSNFEILNLGNSQTIMLKDLISTIEDVFQKKAVLSYQPEQPGDVPITFADIKKAKQLIGYEPRTNFYQGMELFKKWWYEER